MKKGSNIVFIAKSIDGFIADKKGGLDWLHAIPNPDNNDMGYNSLINRIDAIIMGRNTFEVVDGFGIDWPYTVPVLVASNTLTEVPEKYKGKIELINGTPKELTQQANQKGFYKLYIDGGSVIKSFLSEDLVDELILTTIPILLGGGIALFGDLDEPIELEHVKSEVFLKAIVQDHYKRKR